MLIQLLVLLLLCSIATSYFLPPVLFGNTIRDLYGNSTNDMTMMATQWASGDLDAFWDDNLKVGALFGEPLLGGPGLTTWGGNLLRTYTQLPPHNIVYFDIAIKLSDRWPGQSGTYLILDFGSPYVASDIRILSSTDAVPGYPGLTVPHWIGKIPHSASSLTMKFTWGIRSSNRTSWIAIRDVSLSLRNESPITKQYGLITLVSSQFSPTFPQTRANCSSGYFLNVTTCLSCHSSCQNCFGPSDSECYSCAPTFSFVGTQCVQCTPNCTFCSGPGLGECLLCNTGYTLDFNGACTLSDTCNASPFLIKTNSDIMASTAPSTRVCTQPCASGTYTQWNYTCTSSCEPPLQKVTNNGISLCQFPCNKTNNEYLYPNGSCVTSCPYEPRNETGYLFCEGRCQGYLYQNQSCLLTCPAPYAVMISGMEKTCTNPCPAGQYLYLNRSCLATCPQLYAVRIESTSLFCSYPCATDQFLYSNGSCFSSCPANFLAVMDGNNKLCNYPCSMGSYLYDDGSCSETCPSNFIATSQGVYQLCSSPCPANRYLYANGSCMSSCGPGFSVRNDGNLSYCDLITSTNTTNNNTTNSTYECPANMYMSPFNSGICLFCDSVCGSCTGPSSTQCTSCNNGTYLNASTCLVCDSSCTTCSGPLASDCLTPNTNTTNNTTNSSSNACANTSLYKYQNGSCLPTCPYPFLSLWQNGSGFCNTPCNPESFFYQNGTCLPSCESGFMSRIEGNLTFCDEISNSSLPNPCQIGPDYNNMTSTNCTNQDNACMPGYFEYQNGSCLIHCTDPDYGVIRNESAYCNFPDDPCSYPNNTCSPADNSTNTTAPPGNNSTTNNTNTNNTTYNNGCSGDTFYKYQNGSCLSTCAYPFISIWQNGSAYCNFPCASGFYIFENGTCITSCDPGYTPRIQDYLIFCDKNNTNNTTANTPSVVLEIYIRYNISLSSFNSQDGLAKFVQQLAALLGIDSSYITIVSIREGSTIIESTISIASSSDQESMNTAMQLAETMGNEVSDAVTGGHLNIISGVSVLDYKKSIQVVKSVSNDNQIQASTGSSNSAVPIGLGVGLAVLGAGIIGYMICRYKKNLKHKAIKAQQNDLKAIPYEVEANVNQTNQERDNESQMRIKNDKERDTINSMANLRGTNPLEEIDIPFEEKEMFYAEQQDVESQTKNIELKTVRIERKGPKDEVFNAKASVNQTSREGQVGVDESLVEIDSNNEIKPSKQMSVSKALFSLEQIDIHVDAQEVNGEKAHNQEQENEQNVDIDLFTEREKAGNLTFSKQEQQEDDEEKPMSLDALMRQSI